MPKPQACADAGSRENRSIPMFGAAAAPRSGSLLTRAIHSILQTDHAFSLAVSSTLIAQVATLLMALCLDVLVARQLGPQTRGAYALAILAVSLSVQVLDLGFSSATTYFLARKPHLAPAILGNDASLILCSLLATTTLAFTLLRLHPHALTASGVVNPLTLCALTALVTTTLAYNCIMAALYGHQSIRSANRMPVLHITVFFTCAAALIWISRPTVGALLWSASIGRLVAIAYGLGKIRWPARCAPSLPVFLSCGRFAAKEYASNLTTLLAYRADQFIVAALAGTTELGLYAVAASITERLNLLPGAIASVLMPKVASEEAVDTLRRTRRILRGTIGCAVALAMLLAVSCPFLIRFLYGSSYGGAVLPILLLLPGSVAMAAAKLASSHLMGQGQPGPALVASILAALLTTALDFALIPSFGIAGAAAASTIGYCGAASFLVARLFAWGRAS